ncbi:MAG: HD domain-containing protein [archaeon]|nr:HD domain-containing protein [archaeon]
MDYNLALEFATKKHMGQKRVGGDDYIIHPYTVSKYLKEKGYDENYQVAGLFHDLLEDTDATEEEILSYSNQDVLDAVIALTKKENYVKEEYFAGAFRNKIASEVKMADRLHNLRDAVKQDEAFKIKYIKETKDYFYPLIQGKDFEKEIIEAVNTLCNTIR